ncbi:hypothetical protein RUM44_000300 [Polyplax serrata]|uniref:Uncharacterized protein n=1 Tax=Polyplax serrata TaxID=468196 RepID=A0ABR1B6F8_POLSC
MAEENQIQKSPEMPKKPERERFRLRFARSQDIGKSHLSNHRLPESCGSPVTSKFYAAHDALTADDEENI